jgi:co-chaperonin GroES (HSP10)
MFNEQESLKHSIAMEKLKQNPSIVSYTPQAPIVVGGRVIDKEAQTGMTTTIKKVSAPIQYIKASEIELYKINKQRPTSGIQRDLGSALSEYFSFTYGIDNINTNEEKIKLEAYPSLCVIKDYKGNIIVTYSTNKSETSKINYDRVITYSYEKSTKTWYKKVFSYEFTSKEQYAQEFNRIITYFYESEGIGVSVSDLDKTYKLTEFYHVPVMDTMVKGKIKSLTPIAYHDKTVVRIIPEEDVSETEAGLLLINRHTETDKLGDKKHSSKYFQAQILVNGPGIFVERDGYFIPNQFEVGDYVLIGMYAGMDVMIDAEDFKICREFDIACRVLTLQLTN